MSEAATLASSCLVVMYHYVRDSAATAYPAIRALPPALFEQQLDWLEREYDLVDPARLVAAVNGRSSLPATTAVLTFDDGFLDHHATVFPILRARGLKAMFFVAEDTVGPAPRVLNVHKTHFLLAALGSEAFGKAVLRECASISAEASVNGPRARVFGDDAWEHADERAIKHLLNYELPFDVADGILDTLFARHIGEQRQFAPTLYLDQRMIADMGGCGMTFGYHTRSHRMLSRLSSAEQASELRNGVRWIGSLTGQVDVPFCYPWGGSNTYTAETITLLGEFGYSVAFNTVRRRVAIGRDGRFELPRLDARDLPPYTVGEPAGVVASSPVGEA